MSTVNVRKNTLRWPLVWRNGLRVDAVSAEDRGLAFGDGLFETVRTHCGIAPLIHRHWHRLEAGCKRLSIVLDREKLESELRLVLDEVSAEPAAVIKIIVTRGQGPGGYAVTEGLSPTRLIVAYQLPCRPSVWWSQGVTLWSCDLRLAHNPRLAGIKHLNRLENVLARLEWSDPGIAEGLLRDVNGNYVEATASNLFLNLGDRLVTPDLSCCGVAGVVRQLLIDGWFEELNLPVSIATIRDPELESAHEVFVTNSLIGAWPVRRFGALRWPVGRACRVVQAGLRQVYGELW